MAVKLSRARIKKELIKCGTDPSYFINEYVKIVHPTRGLVPFKTYDYQALLLKDFESYRFNLILKARQLGITTITAAYIAWMMNFRRERYVIVVATKEATASIVVDKVKKIFDYLPKWLITSKTALRNTKTFKLKNGSMVRAFATSDDVGRGGSPSLLVVDEAAHIDKMESLWTGLGPVMIRGGRCIALSTPKGAGGWFYDQCEYSKNGDSDFHMTTLPWNVHPEQDVAWFEKETRNMSKQAIAQELECNFNLSGETVFSSDIIERVKNFEVMKMASIEGFDRNLYIWEKPRIGRSYLIAADVGRGDGESYSVAHVFDLDSMRQVAEYRGKIVTDAFGQLLFNLGQSYGFPLLVVENNNVGIATLNELVRLDYPTLYWTQKSSKEYVEHYAAQHRPDVIPGFTTSPSLRPMLIEKLNEYLRNKRIIIRSVRTLREFVTFVYTNGRPMAMRGHNDDLILALAILCWVADRVMTVNTKSVAHAESMIKSARRVQKTFKNLVDPNSGLQNGLVDTSISYDGPKLSKEYRAAFDQIDEKYQRYYWVYKG